MAADGSVIIDVDLNVSDAEKSLKEFEDTIKEAEKSLDSKQEPGISEALEEAKEKAGELRKVINAVQKSEFAPGYSKEAMDYMNNYAKSSEAASEAQNEMLRELEKAESVVKSLESQGKWFGDEDYDKAIVSLQRINSDIKEYQKSLLQPEKPKNPFGLDTISGKVKEAELELDRLKAAGKGLGDTDYDNAFRSLALLKDEAKQYAAELAKTPAQAEKEADALERAAKKAEAAAAKEAQEKFRNAELQAIRDNAVVADQRIVDLNKELETLKSRLSELKSAGVGQGFAEYDRLSERVKEINADLKGVASSAEIVSASANPMSAAMKKAEKSASRFAMRFREVVRSALVFTIITQALANFRAWMGKVIKTNDEAAAAIAKLKGALLTLAQPLVNVIIPAFTTFVNVLTRLITSIAKVLSMLFGSTIEQSKEAAQGIQEETAALEGMGGAADEAGKSMASFDEINPLSGNGGAGGGGGAASTEIAPDFEFDTTGADGLLKVIEAIGAALLAWRISSALGAGLSGFLGILLAIYSAIQFVKNMFDAWVNGVSWDNLLGMILSAAGLAAGLGIALGPVAAGISLIVTGLAMLATGFHDAFENGWNLQNLLLSMAGILATGIGIGLLTGSWISLLIAAIAAILLAITTAYGQGEALLAGVKQMLQGFLDFFRGIFTGDLALTIQGIGAVFGGLNGIVQAILDAVKNMFNSFLDWLDEKTQGKLTGLIEWIRGFLTGHIEALKVTLSNIILSIQQIFTGLVKFVSGVFTADWELAWQGVTEVFKGIWNTIVSILEGGINFLINGINFFIDGLNRAFNSIRALTGYPPKIPRIQSVELPRLATGAVIPPNREFLAVLGDQKSGTNIEAPLDTIVQAVMLALSRSSYGGGGGGQVIENVVNLDGEVIYRNQQKVSRRHGRSLANK